MTLIRQATADSAAPRERASATPSARIAPEKAAATAHQALPPARLALHLQQRWLLEAITSSDPGAQRDLPNPSGDGGTPTLAEIEPERVVTRGPALDPAERVDIYRHGYRARLVECLADDYPVLQYALGSERFESLCHAYIDRHPSQSFSLNAFGRHMPDFCRTQPLPDPDFAGDLSTLEWAIVLAIHAEGGPSLDPDALARVAADRWAGARLAPNPSLRFLHLRYPANVYLQSYRSGAAPVIPEPRASAVAVYRTGRSVWRMDLAPATVVLFEALAEGATLTQAVSRAEPLLRGMNEAEAAGEVMSWFRDGVASGIFAGISFDTD